jgi:hypothetical protein
VAGHLAKRCNFRAQVDELVQRHKRDSQKANGDRRTKKNKARHGYNFSADSRGNYGRPPRGPSPDRKKLRWGDSREINFLEGAELNCLTFDEREPSSYVAMVDAPQDPEEPNAVPPPPSPPDESDSDMEEASVSSTEESIPDLVTDSDSDDEPDGDEICRQIRIRRPPRNLPTIQAATRLSVDIFPSLVITITIFSQSIPFIGESSFSLYISRH